jgi:hypothetical protein
MDRETPAFIVQSLDQARDALTAARAFSCAPLLLSPQGYAATLGAAVFQAMIHTLRREFPNTPFANALDCGLEPGHALAALRAGVEGVVIGGNAKALIRIKDMAAQSDCMVYSPDIYEGEVLVMCQDRPSECHDFLTAWHERKNG